MYYQQPQDKPEELYMTTTVPAITATMGSRTYYIAKMRASELAMQVAVASELSEWKELSLNEMYQRKLNEKRVQQEIAPYLANTPDRFFGSIIVWITGEDSVEFEPVSDQISVRAPYREAAESIGFLILSDSKSRESGLVALDGQHRLAALREVIQNKVEGQFNKQVREDEVGVIFVRDEKVEKARDLFTVLNRSARRVSKSDVLIMSESDGAAIIARELTSSKLLAPHGLDKDQGPLIKWEVNTIAKKDPFLTTLNAIYEVVQIVAQYLGNDIDAEEDSSESPEGSAITSVKEETHLWLSTFFSKSSFFQHLREDASRIPEARKQSEFSLILRPVGFVAFFLAVQSALDEHRGQRQDLSEVIEDLLRLDWSHSSTFWKGIMVNNKGNITNKQADLQLAGDLAAWLICGKDSTTQFQQDLVERYRKQLGREDATLPEARI